MKNKFLNKKILAPVRIGLIISVLLLGALVAWSKYREVSKTTTISSKVLSSGVMADGQLGSANESNLHFVAGGYLTYLAHSEGDSVYAGETIAALDTRQLQSNLGEAQDNLRAAQANVDKVLDDIHQFQYGNGGFANVGSSNETETQRQLRSNAEAARDSAQDAVNAAQAAFQNSTLVSPISGVLVHSDVKTSNVNVTPTTSFLIEDPSLPVFHAYVSDKDIDFIKEGQTTKIMLRGQEANPISGTVSKIYPGKETSASGESFYKVDIISQALNNNRFGQSGTVLIQSDRKEASVLIPSWLVINHQYVWVMENKQPRLKTVKVGQTFGLNTEILSGLEANDAVIATPQFIAQRRFLIF